MTTRHLIYREYLPITNESQLEVHLDLPEAQQPQGKRAQTEQDEHHESSRIVTRSMKGISKPKTPYVGSITVNSTDTEPQSVTEALSIPHWKQAMKDEFHALQKNQTWELVPYHCDLSIVDCKWIYKTKYKPNGEIERFKARLVAKGFQQDPRVSFGNTFSPVARIASIRIILVLATSLKWKVRQLDVNNAFLNGVLQEDVYMWQPRGFEDQKHPTYVCKLRKALYGLRQAPRAWFESLRNTLLMWGFYNTKGDTSLFVRFTSCSILIIIIYVDDILVTGSYEAELQKFTKQLNNTFSLKDLGDVHYFFGIEIDRDETGMFLSQKKYILDL